MLLAHATPSLSQSRTLLHTIFGALFLALLAQITVPLSPIPMTLQTLGVFLIALYQGGRQGALSTLFYLALATMGAPVLSGGIPNPLWMFTPKVGYIASWPIAAFICGTLYQNIRGSQLKRSLLAVLAAQTIIYSFGIIALCFFIPFSSAIQVGFLPFISLDLIKLITAISIRKFI